MTSTLRRIDERLRGWMTDPRVRIGVAVAILVLAALLVHHHLRNVTATQKPAIWHDSHTFLETAAQPLDLEHVFYPKPFVAPAVDRIAGEPAAVEALQIELAFWSWLGLAVVLFATLRRWRARIIGLFACGAFLLAPVRVGFASAVASESIDDSLRAIVIAIAIALTAVASRAGKHRILACALLGGALVVAAAAWMFTRDTNAIIALAAIAIAAWRTPIKAWWRERWPLATAAAIGVAAILSIWSSQVVPRQPLGLSLTEGWAPESTARGSFALVDDFMIRVMPDREARARAIADGLPWSAQYDHYIGTGAYGDFLSEPQYAPTRAWIFAHGTATYLGWLVRHPLQRIEEVVANTWNILTPPDMGPDYMPIGWRSNTYGGPIMRTFRSLTESPVAVLILLIGLPVLWRRARTHALAPMIVCVAWSALLGVFAAYYGDAMEMMRHVWGTSQQLLVGLVLVLLAWADPRETPRV